MHGIKERPEFEAYQKVKLLGEGSFGKAIYGGGLGESVQTRYEFHFFLVSIHSSGNEIINIWEIFR